jgi:hypothetical protein
MKNHSSARAHGKANQATYRSPSRNLANAAFSKVQKPAPRINPVICRVKK